MLLLHPAVHDKQSLAEEDNREHSSMSQEPSGDPAARDNWWHSEGGDAGEDL